MRRKLRRMWNNPAQRLLLFYVTAGVIAVLVMFQMNGRTEDRLQRQADQIQRNAASLKAQVHERCLLTNKGRAEGNKRGEILIEFLTTASDARRATALASDQPWERLANAKAAKRYTELASRIEPYPYLDCNDDGKPDKP